jgi:hypothetical protein
MKVKEQLQEQENREIHNSRRDRFQERIKEASQNKANPLTETHNHTHTYIQISIHSRTKMKEEEVCVCGE